MIITVNTPEANGWVSAEFTPFEGQALTATPVYSAVHDYGHIVTEHAMQSTLSLIVGSSTSNEQAWANVSLQGSLDGVNWYGLGIDHSYSAYATSDGSASTQTTVSIGSGVPARYVRAIGNATFGVQPGVPDPSAATVVGSSVIYRG